MIDLVWGSITLKQPKIIKYSPKQISLRSKFDNFGIILSLDVYGIDWFHTTLYTRVILATHLEPSKVINEIP